MSFDAVILAGGAARRLGGIDKATIPIGDRTLLERVLDAVTKADRIVCVGPERPTSVPVGWTTEDPPGGGPAPALAAGLTLVQAPVVAVLAVDLPFVTSPLVAQLVAACPDDGGALVVDENGVPQPLLAAYAADPLRRCLGRLGDPTGLPMNRILDGIPYVLVEAPGASRDCDNYVDITYARRRADL